MKYTIIRKYEDNTLNWKKMTLRELAKRVGCHFTTLCKLRKNVETCSEELYLKIKKELS